jgi:deoxyribodipyrimidine photo-lyase
MDALTQLESDFRVSLRRGGPPDSAGRCVVYWMRRSQRAVENPALNVAINAANAMDKPAIVFFGLLPASDATLRHYAFMLQGLAEVRFRLEQRRIPFVLRRYPDHSAVKFCQQVGASLLVTDENPLRGPELRLSRAVREMRIPVWSVDADVVVPAKMIGNKQYAARIIRPRLLALRDEFLEHRREPVAKHLWRGPIESLDLETDPLATMNIDRSILPVSSMRGGTSVATELARSFVAKKLTKYPDCRNHPELDGTSRLSPYLHFGQISPVTVSRAVLKSGAPKAARDAYLDQLITWRELAINFVRFNEHYDTLECAEPWARRTLAAHAKDPRPVLYTAKQLESAETHDPLWNAAQIQMIEQGWMHNYMRMYWAKKILEWTRSPAEAFAIAVRLNDKYEVDGRDPNGYAGVAWAITGKLDRPWFERPIFGQVRYMSAASTGKKFDSQTYIRQNSRKLF